MYRPFKVILIFLFFQTLLFSKSIDKLRSECEAEIAKSCFTLGEKYEEGREVEEDLLTSLFLYKRACELGSGEACSNLGTFFEEKYIDLKDFNRAVSLYKKACDLNDSASCYYLGHIYKYGNDEEGIRREPQRAKLYFNKSFTLDRQNCLKNDAESCASLGFAYENGDEVVKDVKQAEIYLDKSLKLYKKGCENNITRDCYGATEIFDMSETIKMTQEELLFYYRKLCDLDESIGCQYLGKIYFDKRDLIKAKEYYERACSIEKRYKEDFLEACEELKRFKENLTFK